MSLRRNSEAWVRL